MASTISGFVALIAVGALNAIAGSAQTVSRTTETTSEIRFAARMIARDLSNLYRDPNPQNMKLVGSSQGEAARGSAVPDLLHLRPSQSPGEPARGRRLRDRVFPGEPRASARAAEAERPAEESSEEGTVLFRRVWPNPDKDRTPGGVLTPIAENIGIFQIRFYDGKAVGR